MDRAKRGPAHILQAQPELEPVTPSIPPRLLPVLVAGLALLSGCDNVPLPVATQGMPAPEMADMTAPAAAPLDPALLQPATTDFHIGPGDRLEIETMGDISTLATVTVGPDGRIYYYILPGIDVWGLTLPQAREAVAEAMNKFVRAKPSVMLVLQSVASQQVWLMGRLSSPGVYSLGRPTSLLDAVAQAGGLAVSNPAGGTPSESADLSRSFLIRNGHLVPVDFERLLRDGDLSQNIYLQPGDFVFMPSLRSAQVHVVGAVVQPRSVRMAGSMTLIQAIALAGGSEPQAYLQNVAILRGSLAHPQIAVVAVDKVLLGRAPDVRLLPGDIVYVPYSPNRVLVRYMNLILDTFVRTVGVNEGAYAITDKATPVSIGVNINQ
jgi:polysaccharide export outer membrane protein